MIGRERRRSSVRPGPRDALDAHAQDAIATVVVHADALRRVVEGAGVVSEVRLAVREEMARYKIR